MFVTQSPLIKTWHGRPAREEATLLLFGIRSLCLRQLLSFLTCRGGSSTPVAYQITQQNDQTNPEDDADDGNTILLDETQDAPSVEYCQRSLDVVAQAPGNHYREQKLPARVFQGSRSGDEDLER